MSQIDLERLVCAGAVDGQFRELLLRDPLRAAEGYHTNRFALTTEERTLLANIQTADFDTFVQTVANSLAEKSVHPSMRNNLIIAFKLS